MNRSIIVLLVIVLGLFSCENRSNNQLDAYRVQLKERTEAQIDSADAPEQNTLRVAVATMISPKETFVYYKDLLNYLGERLGRKIQFKQRKTYKEVNDMIQNQKLDLAFVCSGAYVQARKQFPIEILAVPIVEGKPFYRAYVIVHRTSPFKKFEDLKGNSFAFTDPLSNTGFFYVRDLLEAQGTNVAEFFSKTIFTYAHDYSIQAVSRKIVDGASVDGLIYDYLKETQPEKVENTRIIQTSGDFGIPPIVTHGQTPQNLKTAIREVLLTMHQDSVGKQILQHLNIDRFALGDPHNYDMIK